MKKITKCLLFATSVAVLTGCSDLSFLSFLSKNKENVPTQEKDSSSTESDFEILQRNQHTPSDKIDVQLDTTTHECIKVEVACGTHNDCWPYRCVDKEQFVDNIEIIKQPTSISNGSGINHVTFNSIEIGRTYTKDVSFTIPAIQKAIEKSESNIREVSIENEVIDNYLKCDDLAEQYSYLKQTDKGGGNPAKDYQEYVFSWDPVPNREEYKVHISDNPEFRNYYSDEVTGTSYDYGFYVPGKTYYVRVIGDDYDNPVFSDSFKIKDNELRYVNVEGAQNMRDLGGWKTYDGKTVNYELLYRGANFNGSTLHTDLGTDIANGCGSGKLTELGKQQMNQLGFKTEIDLRTPLSEDAYNAMKTLGTGRPSGEGDDGGQWITGAGWDNTQEHFLQADMNGLMYEHLVSDSFMNYYRPIIQKVFDRLARVDSYPVYFHCNAGADRTGTYGFLLNGLLGVQYSDLTKDYQLTSYSNGGGRRWRNKGNGDRFFKITEIDESIGHSDEDRWQFDSYNTWDLLVRRLLERYDAADYIAKLGTEEEGNIIQVCLEKWLLEEGVTMQQINAYRDIMLGGDRYEAIKNQEFNIKINNVDGVTNKIVHGGDTMPKIEVNRPGYILKGYKDNNGNDFNMYQRISEDIEVTAVYSAYCDDLGQDSVPVIEWTTKKAKECIAKNKDYMHDGCSAAFAEGVAQFMPRNEACLDTSVEMPLIDYSSYGYVSFFVTSAWATATLYIDDYPLGEVAGTSIALAKKFNIAIINGNVNVNGEYAYRLTSEQNHGLKPIKLRYVMNTYHKNADLCVSNFSSRAVDYVSMANSYAETLNNVVMGGFNTVKTMIDVVAGFTKYYDLCNEHEKSKVNISQEALDLIDTVKDSINTVTYRIWGEVNSSTTLLAEDILKKPAVEPAHAPFEFAYWGTSEGEFTGFNDSINEDLTLDAYYTYKSAVDGQFKTAKKISTLSYYCFNELNGYYGDAEATVEKANPSLPSGYTFLRWTANQETKEAFQFGSTISDDVTLYAVAKDSNNAEVIFKTIYNVTYKDALGVGSDKVVEVFEEELAEKLAGPVNGDNEFAFWAEDGVEFDFSTPIMEDVELVPYYWKNANSITSNNFVVYEIDKQMNAFAEVNPENPTGWVANAGTGQYMAIVSSGFIEFGLRKANKAEYVLTLPGFNFSEYGIVTFDVKNTWTAASFKINGVDVSDSNIGVNEVFKVCVKGNALSVIVKGVETTLISNLSEAIKTGTEGLVLTAIDSTNGNGGGSFDIYNFLSYRNPVALN